MKTKIANLVRDRAGWRLTQHFFRALFDFGLLTQAGADSLTHLLLGSVGGFVSAGLFITYLYLGKYALIWGAPAEVHRRAVLGDDLMLVGLPMLVVAFVTVVIGESLFPDERDFRVLGPLPVRKSAIFGAKLAALALFTGLLIAVVHASLFPLLLLTSIHPTGQPAVLARLVVWVLTGVGASLLVVLTVAALVGVSTLTFAHGRWRELPGLLRSAVLGVLVVAVPFVLRLPDSGDAFAEHADWLTFLPPAWFVGLQQVIRGSRDPWFVQLAGVGLAALAAAGLVVAASYAVLFRRFEFLMLRS
jgi:hypothetical protein